VGVKAKQERFEWGEEHHEFLRDNYLKQNNKWLAEQLGITRSMVTHRLMHLGLKRDLCFEWTEEKDNYLMNHYESMKYDLLGKEIGCGIHLLKKRLSELDLKKNFWTEEQDEFLKEHFGADMSGPQIAKILNKGVSAVNGRIDKFDLRMKEKEPDWLDEDFNYVKENYPDKTYEEMANVLNRTKTAVQHKMREMGLSKIGWSQEEIQYLQDNYKDKTNKELGEVVGKDHTTVKKRLYRLGLYREGIYWTEEEVNFLKENYNRMTDLEIGMALGRTEGAVMNKLHLGLHLNRSMPYKIPERNVGAILIKILGKDRVKAQYNNGVEKPRAVMFEKTVNLVSNRKTTRASKFKPDYELKTTDGEWIPSEYFGFNGGHAKKDYDIRKTFKKKYYKNKHGKKFISFNIEDLRNPKQIDKKLKSAGYIG